MLVLKDVLRPRLKLSSSGGGEEFQTILDLTICKRGIIHDDVVDKFMY